MAVAGGRKRLRRTAEHPLAGRHMGLSGKKWNPVDEKRIPCFEIFPVGRISGGPTLTESWRELDPVEFTIPG